MKQNQRIPCGTGGVRAGEPVFEPAALRVVFFISPLHQISCREQVKNGKPQKTENQNPFPDAKAPAGAVLIWANEQFTAREWEDATSFRKAVAAIGIKMMMLYGITYRELRKMKWDDYNEVYDCITVNGFELRLPLKLSIQLRNIKDFVFDKKIVNKEKLMFAGFRGEAWNDITSSSGIPDYMGMLIGITSVTSVVKYGISQLLKAGLSDSVIKKMTGASEKVIQGCLLQEDNELKQIINTKVLMADWYYEF